MSSSPLDRDEVIASPWTLEDSDSVSYRPYAGVGARDTPDAIRELMARIGLALAKKRFVLRSGGADGADRAFEWGCDLHSLGLKEIYVPYRGWRGKDDVFHHLPPEPAFRAAKKAWSPYAERESIAPWERLRGITRKFMARNVCQICGPELQRPAEFVICWTPDGVTHGPDTTVESGGTGQAIRIATHMDVAVYNLHRPEHRQRFLNSPDVDTDDLKHEPF